MTIHHWKKENSLLIIQVSTFQKTLLTILASLYTLISLGVTAMSKLQNVAPRVSINAFINPKNTIYCKTRSCKNIQMKAKKLTWL